MSVGQLLCRSLSYAWRPAARHVEHGLWRTPTCVSRDSRTRNLRQALFTSFETDGSLCFCATVWHSRVSPGPAEALLDGFGKAGKVMV